MKLEERFDEFKEKYKTEQIKKHEDLIDYFKKENISTYEGALLCGSIFSAFLEDFKDNINSISCYLKENGAINFTHLTTIVNLYTENFTFILSTLISIHANVLFVNEEKHNE